LICVSPRSAQAEFQTGLTPGRAEYFTPYWHNW